MSRPLDAETDLAGAVDRRRRTSRRPLFDGEAVEATTVDATTVGATPVGEDDEQPTLPLDFGGSLVDPTLIDTKPSPDAEADTRFAEPRWRDSPR